MIFTSGSTCQQLSNGFQSFLFRHQNVRDDHVASLLFIARHTDFAIGGFPHFVPLASMRLIHLANQVVIVNQ